MTLNLLKTLRSTIYSTKHTKNIQLHFRKSMFSKFYINKNKNKISSLTSAFSAYCYGPPLTGLKNDACRVRILETILDFRNFDFCVFQNYFEFLNF